MDIIDTGISAYLSELVRADDDPVLLEMEELADRKGFPIVGRLCGRFLEIMARGIGARRVFEMGSGFGYSAYWFSRAVGSAGEIHCTDTDPDNRDQAMDFLGRARLDGPIEYHVASALDAFAETEGDFDVVYCDIDKDGYPDAWRAARGRVPLGGLFMIDNMLWSGRVTEEDKDATTQSIDETNRMIYEDESYRAFTLPIRDGVVCALRIS
jgi:caffeoyl-CoA O-methyltransferase